MLNGEHDDAISTLEQLLSLPTEISVTGYAPTLPGRRWADIAASSGCWRMAAEREASTRVDLPHIFCGQTG
jgi:hypothetical protein